MKRSVRLLSLLVCLALFSGLISGCTAGNPEPVEGDVHGEDWKYGGTMVIGESREVIQPNFILHRSTVEGRLRDFVFDKLFAIGPDLEIIPRLATSYETEDNQTWIIHLREGVKWHDGEDFTADDVVFYFDFYDRVTSTTKGVVYDVAVKKLDEHTVEFKLPTPDLGFLYSKAVEYVALPEHIWNTVDPARFDDVNDINYLIGTGPFKITKLDVSEEVVMTRNEQYWDGVPYLDGVVMRIIPDGDALEMAFENGEVNLLRPSEALADRVEGKEGCTVNFYPSGNMSLLLINHNDPILSQKAVRQALSYLCNREAMKTVSRASRAAVMTTCFTPGDIGYNPDATSGEMGVYDPQKAVAVLEADGWFPGADGIREKDGVKLSVELITTSGDAPINQILIESCKIVGFEVRLRVVDATTRNAAVFTRDPAAKDFQLFQNGMTLGPVALGYEDHYSKEGNYLCYYNAEVAQAFKDAAASATFDEAQVHFDKIQKIMTDDVAAIWLWSANRGWATNNYLNVEDCGMSGLYAGWVAIGKAYFDKK
jgi:peptide/nickel transport system substrate-binding protein